VIVIVELTHWALYHVEAKNLGSTGSPYKKIYNLRYIALGGTDDDCEVSEAR
jgi:hypothetical protein